MEELGVYAQNQIAKTIPVALEESVWSMVDQGLRNVASILVATNIRHPMDFVRLMEVLDACAQNRTVLNSQRVLGLNVWSMVESDTYVL